MKKYVKFVSEEVIEYPPINKGESLNYNCDEEQLIKDGYKELIEAEKDPSKSYTFTYEEEDDRIIETATEIVPSLDDLKFDKMLQNDTERDTALYRGVTYREILFDSDTDQKVNLLATFSTMSDEDTIIWYGMYNEPLECTKEDLMSIGSLIKDLHAFCWTRNAEIKTAIEEAESVEELDAVEISYTME